MKFSEMLRGYRLLDTSDLVDRLNIYTTNKTKLIYLNLYDGHFDRRINALEYIINERTWKDG